MNRFESHFINTAARRGAVHQRRRPAQREGAPRTPSTMIREEDDIAAGGPRPAAASGLRPRLREPARAFPGTGLVPWAEFFQRAAARSGYDGCITIESFDPDMESIGQAVLHLAQTRGFTRAARHRGVEVLEGRSPAGSGRLEVHPQSHAGSDGRYHAGADEHRLEVE
ncbi:MAG: hypothetical protein MZV70_29300 [Desulfobacterales bacterium]|nr:hypothetical protein [Desulfobacterales bacterium]